MSRIPLRPGPKSSERGDLITRNVDLTSIHSGMTLESLLTYEQRLGQDSRWALIESSRHFEEDSLVFQTMRKITARLQSLGVSYAIVGGMALFQHGLRRYTEDVDILVTSADLKKIHENLEGLGYLPPYQRSKHLRDTELGVRIEFLTTGGYPGDGKVKPVSFPDPRTVSIEKDGMSYLNLPTLVELKLASGMTSAHRLRDLSDVIELIRLLDLPADYSTQLNPYVKEKYLELWGQGRKRYVTLWRNKWLTAKAKSLEEMIAGLKQASDTLEAMRQDGVTLEDDGGISDDYVQLVTTDAEVAKKYGMIEEGEFLDEDDEVVERGKANEPETTT